MVTPRGTLAILPIISAVASGPACTVDIAAGTYYCGAEQLCPAGLACNGVDNLCVAPANAEAFTCNVVDPTGDDVPAAGLPLGDLQCVSRVAQSAGCLFPNDPGDWVSFEVPANCTAVEIQARVLFPVAFEAVALELATDNAAPVRVDGPCGDDPKPIGGELSRCMKMTVAPGSHHAIGMVHSGELDCGGGCAFNRYEVAVQLATP